MNNLYTIGLDYGTDSVRAVIINAANGEETASSVFEYPRWKSGLYCNPSKSVFRQHPMDYLEGLEQTIKECIEKAGPSIGKNIKAISIDTTGSSPVAIDKSGTPLALTAGFENNPNAMFVLWKDHTAVGEAAEINAHAKKFNINYLQYVGGIYSSEWFWAKLLHVLREDASIQKAIHSWVEHCDWIPFVLTGGNDAAQIKRGICAAGHKALWSQDWDGLPPDSFFSGLDPLLAGFTKKLFTRTFTADQPAGTISAQWANKLGLPDDVIIGTGAFDAHMGAVGGQIEPYHLSKVMGTSTCDMLVAPGNEVEGKLVSGICGQVNGSIIPGMMGMEAGQSAFGDAYAWFKNILVWPLQLLDDPSLGQQASDKILRRLSEEAAKIPTTQNDELSVDWLNGRRTPNANQALHAAIMGLNLATDAPRLFKSIVEATCFGAKAIVDQFNNQGVPVKGLIGLGGVARKSPCIMQVMADVMGMPIRIHRSDQTCAAGAAMFAATAAGLYNNVQDAMQAMGRGFEKTYYPDSKNTAIYNHRFSRYKSFGKFIEHHT